MSSTRLPTTSMNAHGSRGPSSPPPEPETPSPAMKVSRNTYPQQAMNKLWKGFMAKRPGKPFTILPSSFLARQVDGKVSQGARTPEPATSTYEQAATACKAKVEKIVRECRRVNQKYKDTQFDIEDDFWQNLKRDRIEDCLVPLGENENNLKPRSVKRVEDIFDSPSFSVGGMTEHDVHQGGIGDCWLIAAICTLSNSEDLLRKVCIARDETVGVYGFVFHRDGEWIYEIIDDKLYLSQEDFHESHAQRSDWLRVNTLYADDEYRQVMQRGSRALYFAKCRDPNATWLPLLEKAFAKAHGDYGSIQGGWVGEGLEDLTGGVTTELFTSDIMDKDKFWTDELMNVNKTFLFGMAQMGGLWSRWNGVIRGHAYSIMEARELDGFRLLKLKNPWGKNNPIKKEWSGPWSDGSEEWTADRMSRLNHTFGNNGVFWITYKDFLKHFQEIDRTRVFGADWFTTQQWTSADIPWSVQTLGTHFRLSLSEASPVVLVLCQLDDRYFEGLIGQYRYHLQFELYKDGEDDCIVQNQPAHFTRRSVTAELDLEAGDYSVRVKVTASRDKTKLKREDVVLQNCEARPEKLMSVGQRYEMAHAKAGLKESALEREERLRCERREKKKAKARKAFEARRLANKKEKLRRLRKEGVEKAKKTKEPKNDQVDAINININVGGKTWKPAQDPQAGGGSQTASHEGNNKHLKIVLETSDQSGTGDGDKATHNEQVVTQTAQAAKQGFEGIKDHGWNKGNLAKDSHASTQSTTTPIPTPASNLNDDTTTALKLAVIDAFKLTLDDISDDGLSWSSDIDAPFDSDSPDSDNDPDPLIFLPNGEQETSEEEEKRKKKGMKAEEWWTDPWNAVCVFGLRVFSRGVRAEVRAVGRGN